MNPLTEFLKFFEDVQNEEHVIKHEGVSILDGAPGRGSGRYPLGSGENPNQHRHASFVDRVKEYRKQGMSDVEIAAAMEIYGPDGKPSSGRFRAEYAYHKDEDWIRRADRCVELKEKGMSTSEIGRQMGVNESTVRGWLDSDARARAERAKVTAEYLKGVVDKNTTKDHHGMVDVGEAVCTTLGISQNKLEEALVYLEQEDYVVWGGRVKQVTNKDRQTTQRVLCSPGTEHKEIYNNMDNIKLAVDPDKTIVQDPKTGEDKIVDAFVYPASMDSKRIQVKYADEGGEDNDGIIAIRRNVEDLSLGNSNYSQVRILVDGTHYIKAMAVYGDDKDFENGKDIIFYSKRSEGTPLTVSKEEEKAGKKQVLKSITDDPDNPFGSAIKQGVDKPGVYEHGGQSYYIDSKTGEEKLSLINKRSDEGDWEEWSKKLPAQFLSKQPKKLIEQQLNLAKEQKQNELNSILEVTNPTVKKKLLEEYANNCDKAAVTLEAASLPNQRYQVILPVPSLKDNEVYAPNYKTGDKIALVRFPHEGTFEIPILTVNNRNKEGQQRITGNGKDAVGINKKVANILSGADFDGDTVMTIPLSDSVKIVNSKPIEGLADFNTDAYEYHETRVVNGKTKYYRYGKEFKPITHDEAQKQMGITTNLIADMTLRGAPSNEVAKATKHAMVVIDAEKHKLDYKASEKDNDIAALKAKWQPQDNGKVGGASTIVTKAKSPIYIDKRQGQPKINLKGKSWYDPNRPEGALIYKTMDEDKLVWKNVDKETGEVTKEGRRKQKVYQMSLHDDARELSSGTLVEEIYANYANECKALANKARVEMSNTPGIPRSKSAAKTYEKEVKHLESELNMAESNKPKERMAQRKANVIIQEKKRLWKDAGKSTKEIDEDLKKEGQRALTSARSQYGAKRHKIQLTEKEWEAIQAGAISETKLKRILNYCDTDTVRNYATPRASNKELPKNKQQRIKQLSNRGYTNAEIANILGVSTSTVTKYL